MTRGLGIKLVTTNGSTGIHKGSFVAEVVDESPAQEAGIAVGDVIKDVNGASMIGQKHDSIMKALRTGGPKVQLVVLRSKVPAKLPELEFMLERGRAAAAAAAAPSAKALTGENSADAQPPRGEVAPTAAAEVQDSPPVQMREHRAVTTPHQPGEPSPHRDLSRARPQTMYSGSATVPKSISVLARLRGASSSAVPPSFAVQELGQEEAEAILQGHQDGACVTPFLGCEQPGACCR